MSVTFEARLPPALSLLSPRAARLLLRLLQDAERPNEKKAA